MESFLEDINKNETDGECSAAPLEETQLLVFSSFFFIIPGVYAYTLGYYARSILLAITSLVSANYWRKATYGWRRDCDLIIAKISFATFSIPGFFYITNKSFFLAYCFGFKAALISYWKSGELLKVKNKDWVIYHFIFHILITIGAIISLYWSFTPFRMENAQSNVVSVPCSVKSSHFMGRLN